MVLTKLSDLKSAMEKEAEEPLAQTDDVTSKQNAAKVTNDISGLVKRKSQAASPSTKKPRME